MARQPCSWMKIMPYSNRPATGLKVAKSGGWSQKFYFSRTFPSIAVNILQCKMLQDFLSSHEPAFCDSQEAYDEYCKISVTAAACHDRFEKQKLAASKGGS